MAEMMVPLKIGFKMASTTVDFSKSSFDLGVGSAGDENMRLVGHALSQNNTCTSLSLSGNVISAEGAKGLFGGLEVNRTLKELDLTRCNMNSDKEVKNYQVGGFQAGGLFEPSRYDTSGMGPLFEALTVNRTLKTLTIDVNYMSEECMTHLAEMLKVNRTLETLSMRKCFTQAEQAGCMRVLAEALTVNRTLKTLTMNDNQREDVFSVEGLAHLAEMLKVNQGLTEFRLSCGRVDDEGARTFVEALKVNRTLKELDFANNAIKTPETIKALLAAGAATADRPKAVDISFFGAFAPLQPKRPAF